MSVAQRVREFLTYAIALVALALANPAWSEDRALLELSSESFTLYSALDEKSTRAFATNMERFDRIVAGANGVRQRHSAGPTRVFLVSPEDYREYFQPSAIVVGFFSDTSGMGNDIVMPANPGSQDAYPTVFHEYTHFIQRTQFPGEQPLWFEEGLAELFSTARFNDRGIELTVPKGRLDDLRILPWMPAETFFKLDRGSQAYRQHSMAAAFYAQSWVVMHYAFVGNPPFMREIDDYIARLTRRESPEAAAQGAFGRSLAELDAELRSYARQKTFREVEIPAPPIASVSSASVRKLSAGESARLLAELGIRLGSETRGVDELLKRALTEMPKDARSHAALSAVMTANGDRILARELLRAAHEHLTDEDPAPETALAIASAHWRLAVPATSMTDATVAPDALDATDVRVARESFEKALRLDPSNLQGAHGYAQTSFVLGDHLEEAAAALARAQAAAPASWLLAYDAALINERQGQPEAARAQWQSVLRLAHEGPTRAQAREALGLPNEASQPALALSSPSEAETPTDVVVAAVLSRSLNTALAKVGDAITARTQAPISVGENVLLPKDTKLTGQITQVHRPAGDSNTSMLAFTLNKAVLRDGREIPIRTRLQSFAIRESPEEVAPAASTAPSRKAIGSTAWTSASAELAANRDTPIGTPIRIVPADSPGMFGAASSSAAVAATSTTAVMTASERHIQLSRGTILVLAVEAAAK
jgi:tetratricopeptide (TPR) repeat protein